MTGHIRYISRSNISRRLYCFDGRRSLPWIRASKTFANSKDTVNNNSVNAFFYLELDQVRLIEIPLDWEETDLDFFGVVVEHPVAHADQSRFLDGLD
jgi:hypothetical protein